MGPPSVSRELALSPGRAAVTIADGLHRTAARLLDLADADCQRLGAAVLAWTNDAAPISFDAALGLPSGWRDLVRRERRNAALIGLAERRFPGLAGRALAAAVASAMRRYEASSWPRDRRAGRRPDGMAGDIFDLLALGETLSESRMRSLFNEMAGSCEAVAVGQRQGDFKILG